MFDSAVAVRPLGGTRGEYKQIFFSIPKKKKKNPINLFILFFPPPLLPPPIVLHFPLPGLNLFWSENLNKFCLSGQTGLGLVMLKDRDYSLSLSVPLPISHDFLRIFTFWSQPNWKFHSQKGKADYFWIFPPKTTNSPFPRPCPLPCQGLNHQDRGEIHKTLLFIPTLPRGLNRSHPSSGLFKKKIIISNSVLFPFLFIYFIPPPQGSG